MNTNRYLLPVISIITVILWASAFVGIRYGLRAYHPGSMALLRYLVASICMVFVYYFVPNKTTLRKRDVPIIILCGLLGIGLYNISLNYAEQHLSAAVASFTISQVPVVSTLLAVIFLGERPKLMRLAGITISFFGVLLIALNQPEFKNHHAADHGLMILLITLLCSSLYTILQKPLFQYLNPIQFVCYVIWSGTLILLVYTPQLIQDIQLAPRLATGSVIYLGIFPATIAYILWSYLLAHTSVTKVAGVLYSIPLITMLLGWLLLGEMPEAMAIVGGSIALFGAYLVNRKH